jgi:hypothetical protein
MLHELFRKREREASWHAFIAPAIPLCGSRVGADRERVSWHEIDVLPPSERDVLRAPDMAEINILYIN